MNKRHLLIMMSVGASLFAQSAEDIIKDWSLDQKIAQLFVVGVNNYHYLPIEARPEIKTPFAHELVDKFSKKTAEKLIEKYNIGGIIFVGGGTIASAQQAIHELQDASQTPLLICQDFEWGLNMRLKDAIKFPYHMTLGAIQDTTLVYKLGLEIARQCKALGVHVNFAPVVDVNSNPVNPVINFRAFSDDKEVVAEKGIALMQGMTDGGIIACAKHFCGHGDASVDSHLDLPTIDRSLQELHEIELYPFKQLISKGLQAIMTAHLRVPALDSESCSATVSHNIVTKLLQDELGFKGLIFTDALFMKAISNHFTPADAALQAFIAGSDILIMSEDVPAAISAIKQAVQENRIEQKELNRRVLKIVNIKKQLGLFDRIESEESDISQEIETLYTQELSNLLYESAITLVKNENEYMSEETIDAKTVIVQFYGDAQSSFQKTLGSEIPCFFIDKKATSEVLTKTLKDIASYDKVIVSIFDLPLYIMRVHDTFKPIVEFLDMLVAQNKKIMITLFANPYSLYSFEKYPAIIMAYEDTHHAQVAAAQVLKGSLLPVGKLPITILHH